MRPPQNYAVSVLLALLFCLGNVFGQSSQELARKWEFAVVEMPGGTVGNRVQAIAQDSLGFLWFGSGNGLHRYDGRHFKTFLTNPGDSASLSDNFIEALYVDRMGRLWIGTQYGGLNRYDPVHETFIRYSDYFFDAETKEYYWINNITEDNRGNLWVGTFSGLFRFDPEWQTSKHYTNQPEDPTSLSNNFTTCLYLDRGGDLWVGAGFIWFAGKGNGGLNRYDPSIDGFIRYQHDPQDEHTLISNNIWSVLEDRTGNFWVGTMGDGLHLLDRSTGTVKRLPFDADHPEGLSTPFQGKQHKDVSQSYGTLRLFEDKDGLVWILSWDNGLKVYDPENRKVSTYRYSEGAVSRSTEMIPSGFLWNMYQCQDGSIWFCGGSAGMTVVRARAISDLYEYVDLSNLTANAEIMAIQEDQQGNILLGTFNNGVIRYDETSGKTDQYLERPATIRSIYRDREGDLWLGCFYENQLSRWDPERERFVHFPIAGAKLRLSTNVTVNAIYEYRPGHLFLGTQHNGLLAFNVETRNFRNVPLFGDRADTSSRYSVKSFFRDSKGRLWMLGGSAYDSHRSIPGTGYLLQWDEARNRFISHLPDENHRLLGRSPMAMMEDKDKRLWFFSQEGGFYRYLPETKALTYFNPQQGNFPEMDIRWMVPDSSGVFWIGTAKYVYQFNPENGRYQRYDFFSAQSGENYWNGNHAFLNQKNELIFSWGNGFFTFRPNKLSQSIQLIPPKIAISDFYLSDTLILPGKQRFLPKPLYETEEIVLNHHQNVFSIGLHTFHYMQSEFNRTEYRLDPFEEKWKELGSAQIAEYNKLAPGRYRFRARGISSEGVYSAEKSISIIIRPPWWLRWWAKVAYVLAALAGFYGIYFWRTREHRKKIAQQEAALLQKSRLAERLQQVDKLKDQFLANTSHELRTPLQGIIGLSETLFDEEIVPEKKENLSLIISSGKRLSNLVNGILDFSRLKNYDLSLMRKPVDLRTLTSIVLRNNAPLAKGKELQLLNDLPDDLPPVDGDENRLQQILYNLVGNAIKFTEKGYVKVGSRPPSDEIGFGRWSRKSDVGSGSASSDDPGDRSNQPITNQQITFYVQDTGIGIPPEKREAIFQPFEQGDGSISREFAGTGLGLSISKKLVELHGGRLWVESNYAEASVDKSAAGRGSTFFFTLPISKEKTGVVASIPTVSRTIPPVMPEKMAPAELPTLADRSDRLHILVVDDEPINQQVLKNHLSKGNFQVTQAMNGEEAIKIVESSRHFDLVLLDIMMPRISGYEVCRKIRERFLPSELPVIMITAKNQVQDLVQGLALGANDYLAKPFTKEEFLARVKTQLELHHINSATGRFVPNEFLRTLGRERITEVALGDHTEQEVSVLFSDIRDYMTLAETMTPEENFHFINAFHRRMGPVIKKHGGFINQYLGDAIMAIFPKAPDGALQAAIEMQQVLHEYNAKRKGQNRRPLRVGIGLHSGPLIMGIIGDRDRMDAATIADTVNLASRIEGLTKYYGVNILLSEDSLNGIHQAKGGGWEGAFRYLGQVQVKGKKEPVGIYECYYGDPPELKELKEKTAYAFKAGLDYYFAANFPDAAAAFGQVLKANANDLAARLFLNKAARFIQEGVPEGWTGVEVMRFK